MTKRFIPDELLWQKLEKIDSKITDNALTLERLNSKIEFNEKRLDALESRTNAKLSEINSNLGNRLNTVENKLDDKLSSKWFGIIMAAMSIFFVALQVGFSFISRSAG